MSTADQQQEWIIDIPPGATLEQLEELRRDAQLSMQTLTEELAAIKAQLGRAQVQLAETGMYSDRDWYRRAQGALRHKGRAHQAYQMAMSEIARRIRDLNREANDQRRLDDARLFVMAAKRMLPAETYQQLWDEALRDDQRNKGVL